MLHFPLNFTGTAVATFVEIRLFSIQKCYRKFDRFKKFDQSFLQWLIGVSEGVIADDCEGFGSTTRRKVNGQGNMNK